MCRRCQTSKYLRRPRNARLAGQDHNIPFVALELRFIGGTAIEPMEKRGVTQFMMGLLEEGSGDMDAQAFSIAKDDLAASFSYGSYADVLTVSAKFLTENQDRDRVVAPIFG